MKMTDVISVNPAMKTAGELHHPTQAVAVSRVYGAGTTHIISPTQSGLNLNADRGTEGRERRLPLLLRVAMWLMHGED